METIKIRYRRSLRRKNFSPHTIKNYMHRIHMFTLWLPVPLDHATRQEIGSYVDHLLQKKLSPKTITCHLQTIRLFYEYLIDEEGMALENPVRKISIRLPKPLPRHLKEGEVEKFLSVIKDPRDRAMFLLMLRSGLRVEEVARLSVDAVEYRKRQVFVACGKGAKDRVVYVSDDARLALEAYLQKTVIEEEGDVPRPERSAHGHADLREGHPEEDRALREKERPSRLLSSSSPYLRNQSSQCRRRSRNDPGPFGP